MVVVGASARAAADSANRAGYQPAAADIFGDRDLTKAAKWTAIQDYPQGAYDAAMSLPAGPWIYTGGLENHPELIDRIAAVRPLLGNPGDILRAVRDPFRLAECLRKNGLDAPDVSLEPPSGEHRARWLRKPLRSSGGREIERLSTNPHPPTATLRNEACYHQAFVDGLSYSAVFVAAGGKAAMLGVTRQLVGEAWTGAEPFTYCGSLWPAAIDSRSALVLSRIGDCLAACFRLSGLFGVDLVLQGHRAFVLEVNPRYTASVEVLEHAWGGQVHSIQMHVDACRQGFLTSPTTANPQLCCGKAILFARQPTRVGSRFEDLIARINDGSSWSPLADVPTAGAQIEVGQPVLTVRAAAATPEAVMQRLREFAGQVLAALV
ncbi:MAG: ATP-grasp domain-containing protein [Pirellulaceae bacterium]|nr:ATP-grasp domain-containing protein [Pirellulaceae bacterium]